MARNHPDARGTGLPARKGDSLPTGAINPSWTAHILYFQLIQIGELAIVGASFEITTMAGRRLKRNH